MLFDTTGMDQPTSYADEKEYALSYLEKKEPVPPLLTIFRHKSKIVAVQFPNASDFEARKQQFREVGFFATLMSANFTELVCDSTIPRKFVDVGAGPDDVVEAILVMRCNDVGAWIAPMPYVMDEDGKIHWSDITVPDKKNDFIKQQPQLLAFAAQQFFLSRNTMYLKGYISYMESLGYNFTYYAPYTEKTIEYTLSSAIV